MNTEKQITGNNQPTRKSILRCSNKEARQFFLKSENYCSLELPLYITFDEVLKDVEKILQGRQLSDLISKPKEHDDVNYSILSNKDGKYAWRPFQLIHPVLYIAIINRITEEKNWQLICERFKEFSQDNCIHCLSLPVVSLAAQKDKAEQITHWWKEVEQKSIELALDYEYLLETDITDCYGSIYTHSIAWALHTKPEAKKRENKNNDKLIGVVLDKHIQDMQYGQTNGIPQGSALMDFIAEMILGYADLELSKKLDGEDYYIVRYRDDYRIFVNNSQLGEKILKLLTETLIDLGLKLNPSKTRLSSNIIQASIKADKLHWIIRKQSGRDLQKHLLIIHDHAKQFPNSGSLIAPLGKFQKLILKSDRLINQPLPLISIVADIAYRNPRTCFICAAVLAELLAFIPTNREKQEVIEKIKKKFSRIPNTGHMQIWLQRITYAVFREIDYDEPLCKLVLGEQVKIWNSDWITFTDLQNAVKADRIIDTDKLARTDSIIPIKEIELFFRPIQDS